MEKYISAAEVCALLGVSKATVYSYVSRGKLRSIGAPGTRERRYWLPDVQRLSDGDAKTPPTEQKAVETSITLVTKFGPYYRGQSALKLAETASLEAVAGILWQANAAELFSARKMKAPAGYARVSKMLGGLGDAERAIALFTLLESADPASYDLTPAGMAKTGSQVLRWLFAIALDTEAAMESPLHLAMAKKLKLAPEEGDLIRRLFVIAADNGLVPATIAVRSVASTGVTPWRAVATGLTVATGIHSRLRNHGEALRFVRQVIETANPRQMVIRRLRDGERFPGFSSPPYPEGDPRGAALFEAYARVYEGDVAVKRMRIAIHAIEELTGQKPSFELANIFLRIKLGMAEGNTPFILARTCGWVAHAIEQYRYGQIVAGAALYRGSLPLETALRQ